MHHFQFPGCASKRNLQGEGCGVNLRTGIGGLTQSMQPTSARGSKRGREPMWKTSLDMFWTGW